MGNRFFADIHGLYGGKSDLYNTTLPLPGFDPTDVPIVTDPACIDVFDKGGLGVGYSSIAIRIPALIDLAIRDESFKEDNITAINALGCFEETSGDVLRCDWNLVYNRIVTECQVANLRGVVLGDRGNLEGNCEELLGITPEMIKDGTLDPKKEWCPAYYDGQEGEPTLASIVVVRDNSIPYRDQDDDYAYEWHDLTEKTLGFDSDKNTFIFENVPYCTAFDSCTDEDFFTMVNAEAAAYAAPSESDIKILPNDKKSRKSKKSNKTRRKTRRKMRVL